MLGGMLTKQLFQVFIVVWGLIVSNIANAIDDAISNTDPTSSAYVNAQHLALIVNKNDQGSINVAQYYQEKHHIADENIIFVDLPLNTKKLTFKEFDLLKADINRQLLASHHAVLFVWTAPYAVECFSITSAFTLGVDEALCKNGCGASQQSPFFNKPLLLASKQSSYPISMLLPTDDFDIATKVIDNGILSQQGAFKSTAYFIKTQDTARNSRAQYFPKDVQSALGKGLSVITKEADSLMDVHDIMIYQIGSAWVNHLPTINFLPGALADHLTSFGGDLYGNAQMNVLSWLKHGATASYGTVSEPCNYWQKFPHSTILLQAYVNGATAIEAYWQSVAWPSQGLLVGDPLAAPYAQ